jgi:thiamine-phosphate pyrophosphorylase
MKFDPSLCLVVGRDHTCGRELVALTLEAVAGGVTMVQLREKEADSAEFLASARALKAALAPTGVPLFINDSVEIARLSQAEGIHLGQRDMPCAQARAILGTQVAIGLSVETRAQALDAETLDVDYLGASPVFATATKTDTGEPWGLNGMNWLRTHSRHLLIGIGGITSANAASVIQSGAHGLAVVSAICAAKVPCAAAQSLRRAVRLGNR